MFRTKRVAACIVAFAAIGASRLPSHNFVDFDLTAKVAKPLPVFNGVSVELLDADSGMRNGDLVSYETLSISQNFQASIDAATHNVSYRTWLVTQTVQFQVSCAWRTIQATGFQTSGDGMNLFFPPPRQIRLLRDSRLSAFVDTLCADRPITAAKGAPSIDATKAQWKNMFPAPGGFKAITVTGTQRTPATAPWMATGLTHKFAVIEKDGTSGNLLFFDQASLVRDGDIATGLSLVLLGPQAQHDNIRFTAFSVAEERQVRYDCASQTLTVLAQATWNAKGEFTGVNSVSSQPRGAKESATASAEIDAACGRRNNKPDAESFATVEDAWASARTGWPAQ